MRRPTDLARRFVRRGLAAPLLGTLLFAPVAAAFGADPQPLATAPPAADPQSVISPDALQRVVSGQKPNLAAPPDVGPAAPRIRQREGAKLTDRRGRFEIRGDRVIFLATEPDAHFVVLENLSLERVTRVLEESGSELEWSVSGSITEFRASNYLQISRALVKSLPAKGAPHKSADPVAVHPLAPAKRSGFTEPAQTR